MEKRNLRDTQKIAELKNQNEDLLNELDKEELLKKELDWANKEVNGLLHLFTMFLFFLKF